MYGNVWEDQFINISIYILTLLQLIRVVSLVKLYVTVCKES